MAGAKFCAETANSFSASGGMVALGWDYPTSIYLPICTLLSSRHSHEFSRELLLIHLLRLREGTRPVFQAVIGEGKSSVLIVRCYYQFGER